MKCELWHHKSLAGEAEMWTFFPVDESYAERVAELLEAGDELVWTVEADSFEEAMPLYHERMGWEPYRPVE
jgi:hypothetical protein